jgi:hypothetical protein
VDDVERELLQRYLEVINKPQVWIGHDLHVPDNRCINGSCCLAWQLHPYQVITLGCDKKLPAICAASITEVSGQFSGSGESDHILVSVNESLQPLSDSHNVVFGTSLKLNCSCNEGLEVKWYINGKVDPFGSESVLELVFTFPGVYRCEAAGGEMDKAINKSVTLCGVDGQPGDIEILSAASYSQTELEVSWSPPKFLGTRDPLLLRYTVYYTSEDILDENSEVQLVIPQLEEHFVTVKLSNLSKGTSYLIGVVATSMKISTKLPTVITVAPTYGEGRSYNFYVNVQNNW